MISVMQKKPSHATAKLTLFMRLFAVSKDEWNTKEDTGKSMHKERILRTPKGTSQAKATSNSKKIKHI